MEIYVDNAKYFFTDEGGSVRIDRLGCDWLKVEEGAKAIIAMMHELEEARDKERNATVKTVTLCMDCPYAVHARPPFCKLLSRTIGGLHRPLKECPLRSGNVILHLEEVSHE